MLPFLRNLGLRPFTGRSAPGPGPAPLPALPQPGRAIAVQTTAGADGLTAHDLADTLAYELAHLPAAPAAQQAQLGRIHGAVLARLETLSAPERHLREVANSLLGMADGPFAELLDAGLVWQFLPAHVPAARLLVRLAHDLRHRATLREQAPGPTAPFFNLTRLLPRPDTPSTCCGVAQGAKGTQGLQLLSPSTPDQVAATLRLLLSCPRDGRPLAGPLVFDVLLQRSVNAPEDGTELDKARLRQDYTMRRVLAVVHQHEAQPTARLWHDLDEALMCGITLARPERAQIGPDGHTYDDAAVRQALAADARSPLTRAPMTAEDLCAHRTLQQIVDLLASQRPVLSDTRSGGGRAEA